MKNLISLLSVFVFTITATAQLDRSVPPKAQPNPEIKIEIPEVIELDNGLRVIAVENHKLPIVSFQLFVDYPISSEGKNTGIGDMMGELLSSGTSETSKDDFDNKIDFMGASFFTTSRGFFASSLRKHTENLLSLLTQVVKAPAFPQDEFDRIKKSHLTDVKGARNNPQTMSRNVVSVVNYGAEHPYGEVTTEKTIESIDLEEIKEYYGSNFLPNNAYLVIVGDLTQDEAKVYAEQYFGDWASGTVDRQESFEVAKSKGNQVYFVDKPGAVQSVISVTHNVELKPGHEDVITLRIMNNILGGGSFSARLMANLREDKAYTYGCYSRIGSDRLIGQFSAGGSFRNEVTDSAIVQIMEEITRISKELVTDEELDLMKKSMTGAFARGLEDPETVARFALNTVRYNLPRNYYSDYLKNLEKVTKEEILECAQKYLRPENLNIVVVGNSEVSDKLLVFDSSNEISFKDHFGQEKLMLKQAPDGITPQLIIDKYCLKTFQVEKPSDIEGKMKKIGYMYIVQTAFIEQMGASLTIESHKAKENKTASVTKAGGMLLQKEWFNGEEGGSFAMGRGSEKYEKDKVESKKKPNFPFTQLHYSKNDDLVMSMIGIDDIDGVEYYKLKIANKTDDDFSYEYYNVKSGMLEIEESFTTDGDGNSQSTMMTYGDYKDVGGLLIPHKREMTMQGMSFDLEVTQVVVKKKGKTKAFDGEF